LGDFGVEIVRDIQTYLSEVLRYLREVIEVNHSPPLFRLATYRAGDLWDAGGKLKAQALAGE
jgi:hypothetical protein